jgi:hypothetical protein
MLDSDTPKGRRHLVAQDAIAARFARHFGLRAESTLTTDRASPVDAHFFGGDDLMWVAEIKDRATNDTYPLTLAKLRSFEGQDRHGYLITEQKLLDGREYAKRRGVPLLVIVGLRDDVLVWWKITNEKGERRVRYTRAQTETWATVNQRMKVVRWNAYLDLQDMHIIAACQTTMSATEIRW